MFAQVSRTVEQHAHTTFVFQNPLSESEELQSWGMFKDSAIIIDAIRRSFLPNQQQEQCLPQFESILDGHLSRHLLRASFRLEIENTTLKRLIGSEPHSYKPFAPILLFPSQRDRLWNKILWQLSVLFHHPWLIKKIPPSMMYKENWLYKRSCNSYTVEDKQSKLGVWTDVVW